MRQPNRRELSYRPLPEEKLPGKGDLVSIDCEFIALNCEQVRVGAGVSLGRCNS